MSKRGLSKPSGASSSSKKQKKERELTRLEHVHTPVVDYSLRTLYGYPFNTRAAKDGGYTCGRLKQKYVDEIGRAELKTHDVLVVKSPMGSGKTAMFLKIIQNYDRLLIVSSRRSYSDYMCTVVPGLVNYQNIRGPISAEEYPRVIIQVQSLRRIKAIRTETTYAQWDLVYIDEPNGVFNEIISSVTAPEERQTHAKYLRKIVSSIPTVVITDAGLAPWHLEAIDTHLLSNLTKRKKSCVVNEYVPRLQRLRVFDSMLLSCSNYSSSFCPQLKTALGKEDALIMDVECFFASTQKSAAKDLFLTFVDKVYEDAGEGMRDTDMGAYLRHLLKDTRENVVVLCNTKSQANLVGDFVTRLVGESALVLLTGDTPMCVKSDFMSDPKGGLTGKRVLCHTTCVSVGVDFNFRWSTQTLVVVDTLTVKHSPSVIDMYQGIGRNRRATNLNLFVHKRRVKTDPKGGGPEVDHMAAVVAGESSSSSLWRPSLWANHKLLIGEDTLDAAVFATNKLERSFNKSPRLFFDVLVGLLKVTSLKPDGIAYADPDGGGGGDHDYFTEELHVERAVQACRETFRTRISKYTCLTLQSFNDVYRGEPHTEKTRALEDIVSALKLFKGDFSTSFFVLRHLNKHLLKQWAIKFNKLQYVEPEAAVDLLRYEEEAAAAVNPDDLILQVKKRLFRNNSTVALKRFEDFNSAVALTHSILDNGGRCTSDTDLEDLTKLLVSEYEISNRRHTAMLDVSKETGLAVYVEPGDDPEEDCRLIMPVVKMKVDIHKMAALMLL
jgi:hypothetical protein